MENKFSGIWTQKNIWNYRQLSHLDRLFLAQIAGLDKEKGCFASNGYFSNFFDLTETNVSKRISKLKKLGFIKIETFNGRYRVIRLTTKFKNGEIPQLNKDGTPFKAKHTETIEMQDIQSKKRQDRLVASDKHKEKYINTFINKSIKNPKGSKKPLKFDKDIMELMTEFIKKPLFRTKLNFKNPTKTLIKIHNFLKSMLSGNWVPELSAKFVARNNVKLQEKYTLDELHVLLTRATKRYAKMNAPEYWPEKKETLTADFLAFLYNPVSQKSWFLFCAFVRPKKIREAIQERVKDTLPKDVQEKACELLSYFSKSLKDDHVYWLKIKELFAWYQKNKVLITQGNYVSVSAQFGTASRFLETYFTYLKQWPDIATGHLGVNNKTWDLFVKWVYVNYRQIKLSFSSYDLKKIEKRSGTK